MATVEIMTVEVVQPYSDEILRMCGVEPGTVEEYAFCLGWQDGVTKHIPPVQPVTVDLLQHYRNGWAVGSLNRIVWLFQGACVAAAASAATSAD